MLRRLRILAALLVLSVLLAGCNRVGLAYRNLDVIIPWTLNDYLDMNAGQKSWFNDTLKEHLAWHCTTQLPGYLDWLDRLQQMVDSHQVSDAALQAHALEAKQAIADVARQITPSAIELLRGLDEQQVREMDAALPLRHLSAWKSLRTLAILCTSFWRCYTVLSAITSTSRLRAAASVWA